MTKRPNRDLQVSNGSSATGVAVINPAIYAGYGILDGSGEHLIEGWHSWHSQKCHRSNGESITWRRACGTWHWHSNLSPVSELSSKRLENARFPAKSRDFPPNPVTLTYLLYSHHYKQTVSLHSRFGVPVTPIRYTRYRET